MSNHEFPSQLPSQIGPYEIVRELGRGGMGIVFEARHQHLQRRVALKLLRPEFAADPTQVERFVREGRAACNIRHPHVIDVYEFDFERGAPYLVMDFLEGETLQQRLARTGRIDLPELLAIMLPVLSGVVAAHAARIVHRDLKPSNIMLARTQMQDCVPKVLDFGTAKLLADGQLPLTQSAAILGTPNYMSPEQLRTARDVDARCDQYALGVILYECTAGSRPFVAESTYALLHAIMTAPLVPPSALVRGLPSAFDAVVMRAMQREPAARYAGVRELGAALLAFAPTALAKQWSGEFGAPSVDTPQAPPITEPAGRTWIDAEAPERLGRGGPTRLAPRHRRGLALAAVSGVIGAGALLGWRAWDGRVASMALENAPRAAAIQSALNLDVNAVSAAPPANARPAASVPDAAALPASAPTRASSSDALEPAPGSPSMRAGAVDTPRPGSTRLAPTLRPATAQPSADSATLPSSVNAAAKPGRTRALRTSQPTTAAAPVRPDAGARSVPLQPSPKPSIRLGDNDAPILE